jgi:NADPH:quinone reductase
LPIPDSVDLATAAALPETWFTAWINLMHHGALRSGESVLIHGGSSGIGLTAIQLVRHVGARSIVTVGNDDKAQFCRDFGADCVINYRSEDFVTRTREFTAGAGVDVVLDMVGGDYVQRNLNLLRTDGRLVFIAFLEGSKINIDLMPVMLKRLIVTGSTMRPRTIADKAAIRDALRREIWPAIAAGKIRTHLHARLPLTEAGAAHRLMESSRHIGKIVLSVRG